MPGHLRMSRSLTLCLCGLFSWGSSFLLRTENMHVRLSGKVNRLLHPVMIDDRLGCVSAGTYP